MYLDKQQIQQVIDEMQQLTSGMQNSLEQFVSDVQAILNTGDLQGDLIDAWAGYQTTLMNDIGDLTAKYQTAYGVLAGMVATISHGDRKAATYMPGN